MDRKQFVDLSDEEQMTWTADYYDSAMSVRGSVLNAVTGLEMSIDLYITHYFTNDDIKSEELMNLIIAPRMSFENKVQVLMVLIERYDSSIIEENKSMNRDLINIIEERNIIAHYPLDITPPGLKTYYESGNLTFFKFKNVRTNSIKGEKKEIKLTNSIVYNVNKSEDLLNSINKYHLIITMAIPTAPPPTI